MQPSKCSLAVQFGRAWLLPVLAATLTSWAQGASANMIILPDATASVSASTYTVGGLDSTCDSVPSGAVSCLNNVASGALPLVVAATSGGNIAIPDTSAFASASAYGGTDPSVTARARSIGGEN